MSGKDKNSARGIGRRGFLKGTTLGGAAALVTPLIAPEAKAQTPTARSSTAKPSQMGSESPPKPSGGGATTPGSDYMIDVMRSVGIARIAAIPGNTFKGLHESLINYGKTTDPKMEHATVNHEEASVAFCHGYFKVAGKPMACMMHSTVGLQHGSMALYNAFADRVPVFAIVGEQIDAARREGLVNWAHSVFDGPALVRDFTKWDDTPVSLGHFAESTVRAYKFAMTPPYGPVVLSVDQNLQEDDVPTAQLPVIPQLPRLAPPEGEQGAVEETARLLVSAEHPVIAADRAARTPQGLKLLIELAETLQCPVVDAGARFNFPWRHPLNQSARQREVINESDLVLGLEMSDFYDVAGRKAGRKRISITASDLFMRSNYQDFERFTDVDLALAADAEATLPALLEAVKRQLPATGADARAKRGKALGEAHARALQASRQAAVPGWDDSPITVPRFCMEIFEQIKHEDWGLVSGTAFQSSWPQRLWDADKHHQYIGDAGAYGLGYLPGASLGAAVAHAEQGRLAVAIGGDGDFMFSPGILWAAAHNRIPILYIIHNNRGYHNELMWIQRMASRRNRGADRAKIGNVLTEPNIDYAALAKSMGTYGEGPISNPADLGPALKRAIAVVKRGEPALIDIVSQGR